ncbi:MAG: L,D-transpeptidase family protein [Armatimonadetes bacterium]|nr:L,D-transpeptidase family protein [Armatimonadota bacterium]
MPIVIFLLLLAALALPAPSFAAAAPDATILYLTPAGDLRLANVSTQETRLPNFSLAPGKQVRRFYVSPKGTHVLFETAAANGRCTAWVLDLATGVVGSLDTGLLLPRSGAHPFAPDGRRIALRSQEGEAIAIFSVSTRQRLQVLSAPGLQEAPAWFSDARHLAVPVRATNGGSRLALFDAVTGTRVAQTSEEGPEVSYHFQRVEPGFLVYREAREGVDRWLQVRANGELLETDEPLESSALPADLPTGVEAQASPDGKWVAYTAGGTLYLRYSDLGSESVDLTQATAFLWKPGPPLPERPPSPPPADTRPSTPAVARGVLTLRTTSEEAVEGQPLEILWESGQGVASVRLTALVQRVPKGSEPRGAYTVAIPRVAAARGHYEWPVPWVDNVRFVLRAEALNTASQVLGRAELPLSFRPRELADQREDGIYVHLSQPERQRLYVQEGGRLTMVFLCSGASTRRRLPPTQHPDDPHDHYGTFRVLAKDPDHVSNLNPEWNMPYAMRYLAGHWIHVTSRNQYHRLGRPGSHGCVRLHRVDGIRLYERTPIGTRVVIY